MEQFNLKSMADYLKHILTAHDGEARLVTEEDWIPFPTSDGIDVHNHHFWHYQFVNDPTGRQWLYDRQQEEWGEDPLTIHEINWIMARDNNATNLLKRTPWDDSNEWWINTGN